MDGRDDRKGRGGAEDPVTDLLGGFGKIVDRLGEVAEAVRDARDSADGDGRLAYDVSFRVRPGDGEDSAAAGGPRRTAAPGRARPARRTGGSAPADEDPAQGYADVGGLGEQLRQVRELIELPLLLPQVFERLGIRPPSGVLLHGPPGCGKTLIARTIAQESRAHFVPINGPEIVHKFYGESEAALRQVFEDAARNRPSIIFLDEIDAIAPRREKVVGDVEKRVVAQLLTLLDGLEQRQGVVVIAATNIPDALDPALRRPGRLDREIAIPVPDRHGRGQILAVHSRHMPLAPELDLDRLAARTHGFVGADLEALCREAAMARLRRQLDAGGDPRDEEAFRRLRVEERDFEDALGRVRPSAIREYFVEIPEVSWRDVGGLGPVREQLRRAVDWPLERPDLFQAAGLRPARGILLAGPPGVGKTLLARAVAGASGVNFIAVQGPELMSRYVGESEGAVREVFAAARRAAPCILFFDEVDALLPRRSRNADDSGVGARVLTQFLAEMDGVRELRGVLVLAATNRLDRLDPALLRPGRFDAVFELDLPDADARRQIFAVHLRGRPLSFDPDLDDLARRTEGWSGADIAGACREAALAAVARVLDGTDDQLVVVAGDLENALDTVQDHCADSLDPDAAAGRRSPA